MPSQHRIFVLINSKGFSVWFMVRFIYDTFFTSTIGIVRKLYEVQQTLVVMTDVEPIPCD